MLKFCLGFLNKHKSLFLIYYLIFFFNAFLALLVPLFNGRIIDFIVSGKNNLLYRYILFFTLVNITIIITNFFINRVYIKLQTNTAYEIISKVINHIQELPMSIIDTFDIGYLNHKINNDSNSLTIFIINLIGNLTKNIITIFFSLYILFGIDLILGTSMLSIGFIYLLIYSLLKKVIYTVSHNLKEEQATFFAVMLTQLKNIRFVKIYALIKEQQDNMDKSYSTYYKKVKAAQNFFFMYSSLDSFTAVIANIIIFLIGGNLIIQQRISVGEFTIILSYFNYLISTFKYFNTLGKEYQDNKVSFCRLENILSLEKQYNGKIIVKKIDCIECKNLSFKRDNRIIYNNFNYTFTPGKIYCICGENGSGKTSLIETVIGIYRKEFTGKILFNNVNSDDIDMYSLRHNNISFMEQNIILLEGNAQKNILLSENYSFENINNVIGQNEHIIQKELEFLGTINNNGRGMSGGEIQKLGLYRLLAKESDVYILDEPTTFLDKYNIDLCMKYMYELKRKKKMIIIISHNLETISMCDEVIYL